VLDRYTLIDERRVADESPLVQVSNKENPP